MAVRETFLGFLEGLDSIKLQGLLQGFHKGDQSRGQAGLCQVRAYTGAAGARPALRGPPVLLWPLHQPCRQCLRRSTSTLHPGSSLPPSAAAVPTFAPLQMADLVPRGVVPKQGEPMQGGCRTPFRPEAQARCGSHNHRGQGPCR